MKKVFQLVDLDCANCAAKVENAIAKLEGVTHVNVSFFAQKMTIEAADDKFEEIVAQAVKIAKKVDPDIQIVL